MQLDRETCKNKYFDGSEEHITTVEEILSIVGLTFNMTIASNAWKREKDQHIGI